MIIIQLNGGLGNQMFQYAAGRALSLHHNTNLRLDIRLFDYWQTTDTKRSYQLDLFQVPAAIAGSNFVHAWGDPSILKLAINKYFGFHLNPYKSNYVAEKNHGFDSSVLELPDNIYLSGYWQSEKYFSGIKEIIIKDFSRRKNPISTKNKNITREIKQSNSVSIHVRRSDYVTNKAANTFHGVCSIGYYRQAMSYIERQVTNPIYYVFSDDIFWSRENIKSKHKMIYLSHNKDQDAHEDIRLMSQCKHNIIANSSFSWWGAWLNQNPDKIVIAPDKWYQDKNIPINDLILESWIRI